MKKIDWKDLKNITGAVTWIGVSVMVIHHVYQAMYQTRLMASRSNPGSVTAEVETSQQNNWLSISIQDLLNSQNTRNSQINHQVSSIFYQQNTHNYSEKTTQIIARNCRLINHPDALARNQPQGNIVYQFKLKDQVYIENLGQKGWVPIQYPVEGYVDADNLTDC